MAPSPSVASEIAFQSPLNYSKPNYVATIPVVFPCTLKTFTAPSKQYFIVRGIFFKHLKESASAVHWVIISIFSGSMNVGIL